MIEIMTVKGTWSEVSLQSRWIEWLSSSSDPNCKNIRSSTGFASWLLSEYLVGTQLVEVEIPKLKESAILKKRSLQNKWWE